ncbi:MAG: HAD family hydrolase [Raoultibacter sp.]
MPQTTYRAIFFDLDGTLLPLDMDAFMGGYFLSLEAFVEEHDLDVKRFTTALRCGIGAMAHSDGAHTNEQQFWQAFFAELGEYAQQADWPALLDEFYAHDFGQIGAGMPPNPLAAEVVETLQAKGYPLALTTMPMFPPAAVKWRLNWGDLDPAAFARITTYDNSTAIKPHAAYYLENLAAFGCAPEEVLMVGNNTREDLACLGVGMPAYLVTDCLLDPDGFDIETVEHGSLQDLLAFVRALPDCAAPATCIAPATGAVSCASCVPCAPCEG